MERKKERAEIGSCLANEVKTESLLERLCDKGQSKHLQSVAGVGEKKEKSTSCIEISATKHSYSNLDESK